MAISSLTNGGSATTYNTLIVSPRELWNVSASAVTATTAVDQLTSQSWYYTAASTAGACTINLRGNSTTSMNTAIQNVGESVTVNVLVTTGASTPAYFNTVQVDGTTSGVSTRWQFAATPGTGTTSGVDFYSFTILKTANATFTVFASVCRW